MIRLNLQVYGVGQRLKGMRQGNSKGQIGKLKSFFIVTKRTSGRFLGQFVDNTNKETRMVVLRAKAAVMSCEKGAEYVY